jgi:hypothetical protein
LAFVEAAFNDVAVAVDEADVVEVAGELDDDFCFGGSHDAQGG